LDAHLEQGGKFKTTLALDNYDLPLATATKPQDASKPRRCGQLMANRTGRLHCLDRKLTIYVYTVLLFVAQFNIRCLQRVAAMGLPTPRSTLQRIIVDRYSAVIPR
jgi:hypothetical protein